MQQKFKARRVWLVCSILLACALSCVIARLSGGGGRAAIAAQAPSPIQQQPSPTPTPQPTPAANEPQDDEVVRVETDLASVLLTVLDRDNRFVTTLRKEDLRVLEDNVPQEVTIFQRETDRPVAVALLIDASRSQERTLPDEKRAALAFVTSVLRPGKDAAVVVSFTGEARAESPVTSDLEQLRAGIERVRVELPPDNPTCDDDVKSAVPVDQDPRCWTAVWESLYHTTGRVLARTPEQMRRAVILLSDGDDTANRMKRQQAVGHALRHNVTIYSIGIGDRELYDIDEGALRKVASQTGGRAFFPRTSAELTAAFKEIEAELRAQYFIAYTPANRARDNTFRAVRVEVTNPDLRKQKLRLLYRQGYYARGR